MGINSGFLDTNILFAANLNSAFAQGVNIAGDNMTGTLRVPTIIANTSLTINAIDIGTGLQNAYNAANGAFTKANTGGGGGGGSNGIGSLTLTATNGIAANGGSVAIATGNTTISLTANSATTTVVGVVQLNDTFTSTSTTQAATANAVKITADAASAAYARANTLDGIGSIIVTATGGIAVAGGSTSTLTSNGTIAITGNAASTTIAGTVQLNDTVVSTSTVTAATANSVNTVWSYANAAFILANSAVSDTGDVMHGTLTVPNLGANGNIFTNTLTANSNIVAANIVVSGSVNSGSVIIRSIAANTNYILSFGDSGKVITFSNTGTTLINVNNNLFVGFRTVMTRISSGPVKIQAGPGVTINAVSGSNNQISSIYASVSLLCYSPNTFILDGALT